MTRSVAHRTINPAKLRRGPVKADVHIKYENNGDRPSLGPVTIVTIVFPNSSRTVTIDAVRLREHSALINRCLEADWFEACGRQIYLSTSTPLEFEKYTAWVKFLKLSRRNLHKLPMGLPPMPEAQLLTYTQCLVVDRLIHWWMLGDAMEDSGLANMARELLNHYAGLHYELPMQTFELAWVKSQDGSAIRSWTFQAMAATMTLSLLQARGASMPQDLVLGLFLWFVQDRSNEKKLAAWRRGFSAESGV